MTLPPHHLSHAHNIHTLPTSVSAVPSAIFPAVPISAHPAVPISALPGAQTLVLPSVINYVGSTDTDLFSQHETSDENSLQLHHHPEAEAYHHYEHHDEYDDPFEPHAESEADFEPSNYYTLTRKILNYFKLHLRNKNIS